MEGITMGVVEVENRVATLEGLEALTRESRQISSEGASTSGRETPLPSEIKQKPIRLVKHDVFQHLPQVPPAEELVVSALKRAWRVQATKGIQNAAKRAKNQAAKQLDALTKELTVPLGSWLRRFPDAAKLHPFERSLLMLTLGEGVYETALARVNTLRKKLLDVGKQHAAACAKAGNVREAEERRQEGFAHLESMFRKQGRSVDDLKEVAKTLRRLPVVDPRVPTLCLVGAPNVGKSSLVRVLSSGKPEVCNYPFTTRGISMGHFFVDTRRHQVTDTPGLLFRPDEDRNRIEKLALATLTHLPTAVLFVHDLTEDCGTSVEDQKLLYEELRGRFGDRPWINVVSKADLLSQPPQTAEDAENESVEMYRHRGPAGSLRCSIETEEGLDQLKVEVVGMLKTHILGDRVTHPDDIYAVDATEDQDGEGEESESADYGDTEVKNTSRDFYSPPFNPGVNMNHRR